MDADHRTLFMTERAKTVPSDPAKSPSPHPLPRAHNPANLRSSASLSLFYRAGAEDGRADAHQGRPSSIANLESPTFPWTNLPGKCRGFSFAPGIPERTQLPEIRPGVFGVLAERGMVISPLTETFFNPWIRSAICNISPSPAPNFVASPLRSACRRISWTLPFFSAARSSSSARAKLSTE